MCGSGKTFRHPHEGPRAGLKDSPDRLSLHRCCGATTENQNQLLVDKSRAGATREITQTFPWNSRPPSEARNRKAHQSTDNKTKTCSNVSRWMAHSEAHSWHIRAHSGTFGAHSGLKHGNRFWSTYEKIGLREEAALYVSTFAACTSPFYNNKKGCHGARASEDNRWLWL